MEPELASYAAVCDGVAQLFQPFVEVVLHDLETETAAHIAGNFSKREIGEPSLLHEIDFRPSERLLGPMKRSIGTAAGSNRSASSCATAVSGQSR